MNSHSESQVIRTERVSRHYQMGPSLIRAVDEISIGVAEGEFVALLGSSGSGKSTLLNLIAGLDRPSSGAIVVAGRDLAGMSPLELAQYRRHTVGMVFQSFNLIPSMTLYENVELPMRFAETPPSERRARVEEAVTRVGLIERLRHRPTELSGGEQQRVSLARALVNRPRVLLADEPTGNLDTRTGEEIMELIRETNQRLKMTVVMVTHDPAKAERYAERCIFLADGRVQREERTAVEEQR